MWPMPLHQWRSFSRSPAPVPSFPTRVSSPCFIAGSSSSFSSTARDAGVSTRGLGREKPLLRRRSGSEGWHVRFTMIWLNRYADSVYGIVRLLIGLMFASHGGQKILGFPPSERGLATNPTGLTAGWIELTCGLLIAVGLLTRLAAFIASGEMAVAYFLTSFSGKTLNHAPSVLERLLPILNKGELPVLFCFIFFFIIFYGPGRWSIDALIMERAKTTT